MTLPTKKIYIDTRFKTKTSNSNSDFTIQLPKTVHLPKNTVFYIENFVCSNAFYAVETGINDKFYCRIYNTYYIITITPSNYNGITFASELQTQLNAASVHFFTVVFNINRNNITITPEAGLSFYVFTENDLLSYYNNTWTGPNYNSQATNSTNDILNNNLIETTKQYINTNPYTSGSLELLCFRNIYITSGNLSSFTTIGARGESSIIKKVPVSSSFGYLIIDSFTSNHDWLDCGNMTLSNLEFQLRDSKGKVIPLHGSHVSFSIVFEIKTKTDDS